MASSVKFKLGTVPATNLGLWPPASASERQVWTVWSNGTATTPMDSGSVWSNTELLATRVSGEWRVKYSSAKNGIDSYVTMDSNSLEDFFNKAISVALYDIMGIAEVKNDEDGINSEDLPKADP